jgi:hypothetical protein
MRQEIAELPHQVDAQVRVGKAHMHVHPADQHAPHHAAEILGQLVVAVLVGVVLVLPVRRGVTGDRDRGQPEFGGAVGDGGTQAFEVRARLADVLADPRADLDLALQEFRADLASSLAAQASISFAGASASAPVSRSTSRYSSSIPRV